MEKLKFGIAVLIVLSGFILGGLHIIPDKHYFTGLVLVLSGVLFAWRILIGFFEPVANDWVLQIGGSTIMLFGLLAWMFETNGMDGERQIIHQKTAIRFAELLGHQPGYNLNLDERRIAEIGFATCLFQTDKEMQGAILSAQKAQYFGPGLNLADDALNKFNGEEKARTCLETFHQFNRLRPSAFSAIFKDHHQYLTSSYGKK